MPRTASTHSEAFGQALAAAVSTKGKFKSLTGSRIQLRCDALTPNGRQLFLCNLFYGHYSVFAFGGK